MDIRPPAISEVCPNCGSERVTPRILKRMMPYGYPEPVTLVVDMPMFSCESCQLLYSGEAGEGAVGEAVERYKAVFAPRKT